MEMKEILVNTAKHIFLQLKQFGRMPEKEEFIPDILDVSGKDDVLH